MVTLAVTAMACGGQEAGSQDVGTAQKQAEGAVAAILAGDRETQAPAVCDVLKSGIVSEVFGVDDGVVTYRPGSKNIPHPLCTARWDAPNKAELEAACKEEMMKGGPMPDCIRSDHATEVSLTVTNLTFDSAAAAVESLEGTVAQLEKGITMTIQGKEHTTQVDFDDWMEGVGDKAAWAPRMNELSVAADGVRFAVAVSGTGDRATNQEKAIEVARRVAGALSPR
jgi:hypothetical protein